MRPHPHCLPTNFRPSPSCASLPWRPAASRCAVHAPPLKQRCERPPFVSPHRRAWRASGWKPSITIKQLLIGIQDLLDNPNPDDPAQKEPYLAYKNDKALYQRKVREQAASMRL